MKRIAFIALAAAALVLAGTSAAFANYGPHGSYATDTDACAQCHRAHTATSDVGWTDAQGANRGVGSALLISSATNMTGFCEACHGDGAPGAATDVASGIYDGASTLTNSSADATLNGGGFQSIGGIGAAGSPVMSSHNVDGLTGAALIRWGSSSLTPMSSFTCTDCHDPHGSSNYRLLKDSVNGVAVGGYNASGLPTPYVISNEQGYPSGGWQKGAAGAAQVASYTPDYTDAQYAKSNDTSKGMSGWCSACHTQYSVSDSALGGSGYGSYIPGSTGTTVYHRHPINVALSVGTGPLADRALFTQLVDDPGLPLEMGSGLTATGFSYGTVGSTGHGAQIWDERGNISCLTCHRAHGTEAKMTGFAATSLDSFGVPKTVLGTTAALADTSGVNPTFDAALLRYNNRGVCERCHNK